MAPLALHFNGTIYYPGDDGGLQMVLVPWNKSIDFRMPVSVWRETIEHYYPNTGWLALRSQTLEALQRAKLSAGLATLDACVAALLERGAAMPDALEQLVDSLLYEGYALYPYTPGATKNATPTPFGIVYPPAYAATLASTYDHLELRCVLEAPPDAVLARRGALPGRRRRAPPGGRAARRAAGSDGRRAARRPARSRRPVAAAAPPPLAVRCAARARSTRGALRGRAAGREPHASSAAGSTARGARPLAALHPPDRCA